MKIGVLSDTHLNNTKNAQQLANKLLAGPFADVDLILHAGDAVLPGLEACFADKKWYAVRGNMDHALSDLPISRIVRVAGIKIGMIHGWGSVENIEERVISHFSDTPLDIIIFGHSHEPLCRWHGPLLLFNPGSATDRRNAPQHTVGVLTINESIHGEIISIDALNDSW